MPKNRVIYQAENLFISDGTVNVTGTLASGKINELLRVQSANYGTQLNRVDVNQFGQLARIDSLAVESPNVNVDFEYLLHDGYNEAKMGMVLNSSFAANALSGLLVADGTLNSGASGVIGGRNLFIFTTPEGTDANIQSSYGGSGSSGASVSTILSLGNAYITEYSINAAVGSLPSATASYEGFGGRTTVNTFNTGRLGSIDPSGIETVGTFTLPPAHTGTGITVTALRPGDITLSLGDSAMFNSLANADQGSVHIQNFSISVPLSRSTLQRLGSNFGYAKEIDFPVNIDVSISALASDMKTGSVAAQLIANPTNTLQILMKNTQGSPKIAFQIKGAQLVSENFSSAIGSNKTVDINFTAQVGGPTDTNAGLFISGATTALPFS